MKKKIYTISSMIFATVLCFVLCFALAGCGGETTVNRLISDYGITVDGGDFDKDASLVAAPIDPAGEKGQQIISLLEAQTYVKDGEMRIYDIFVAKDGKEVQPNGMVRITVPAPFESENGYVIFHVKDDNAVETLETVYQDGKISFETDSFSYFVLAEAEKYYTLGVISTGGSGAIELDGIQNPYANGTFSTGRTAGSESVLVATETSEEYAFIGWYGSSDLSNVWDIKYNNLLSTEKTFTFTMPANDYIIYAVFRPVCDFYTVGVINVDGRGTIALDGVECSVEGGLSSGRAPGSESVLVATETLEDYAFVGWYGTMDTSNVWAFKYDTLLSTEKTFTFTMPAYDYIIYAVFNPVRTVYAYADKDTEGTIKWGENNESTSAEVKVAEGKSATLTAVPKQGYKFLGWYDEPKNENEQIGNLLCEDATYTVAVTDMDIIVYARFEKIPEPVTEQYAFTVAQRGAGGYVSVVGTDITITEGTTYTATLGTGDTVTLKAVPRASGYAFRGWFEVDDTQHTTLVLKDNPVSTDAEHTFTCAGKDYTVYAVFEEIPCHVFTANINGSGKLVIGDNEEELCYQDELAEGESVTLTATPSAGWLFKGWFVLDGNDLGSTPISTDTTFTYTMETADYAVFAVFEANITALSLDGLNAGFAASGATVVKIGAGTTPNPDNVVVTGVAGSSSVPLTKDVDYSIDLGGLDFSQAGEYTITFTYLKNTAITATLTVVVEA
ncbi:MAG: InlB B-repeat-containing protein [Eubacteriales bacterium]